ncbi:VirK/YbjX family protein [Oxalobacteraceae bacterium OTU3CAMAD1]|nr:VirK/YbjX family protein [Oxalobacteraceae bacterium OTU3CAMAD1]
MLQSFIGGSLGRLPGARVSAFGPARRTLSRALGLTLNLRQHILLSRLLGRAGAFDTKLFYTGIRYRYLRNYYLGGGFCVPGRLRVAINHYKALARHFQPGFLPLAQRGLHLWRAEYDGLHVGIELRFPYVFNHDGDLCLILRADGDHVYQMTFSIAPGAVVGASECQVLLVSGIQGAPGRIEQIRRVTDTCNNVAPVRMLLMAAEALAAALGICAVIGIGQNHMSTPKPGECEGFSFDYDGFWMAALDATESRDFYHMPLPFPVKPIEAVSAKHRARARQRRAQRDLVRQDIERQLQDNLAPIVRR